MDLVCPAGSLPALKVAIDNGADCVYIGFRDDTNARNFPGLNFDPAAVREGVRYAHARKRQVFLALNTFPQLAGWERAQRAVDRAAEIEVDAVIVADAGIMQYAATTHPQLRLHLSVQGSATNYEAINFFHRHFQIRRAVLPRVLSLAQVKQVIAGTPVEIEVFGFGSLCVMAEGRCLLSSFATGDSPNNKGVCSPAHAVRWQEQDGQLDARLNTILIDRYAPGEAAGYPTLCKGRFLVDGEVDHVLEEPTSLNALSLLPKLLDMGVAAIKIEGRQRSPAYVAQVVATLRAALDAVHADPARFSARPEWQAALVRHAEGAQVTQGAFDRPWK